MLLYTIKLSQLEVDDLKRIINKGSHISQSFRATYILLNCDKGEFSENTKITNEEICKILKVGARTIDRVKKKFVEEGFECAIERQPSTQTYKKKADGDLEAKLVVSEHFFPVFFGSTIEFRGENIIKSSTVGKTRVVSNLVNGHFSI